MVEENLFLNLRTFDKEKQEFLPLPICILVTELRFKLENFFITGHQSSKRFSYKKSLLPKRNTRKNCPQN